MQCWRFVCLEVAFKTGKSLRRSDALRQTVPNCRTGNRKGSVSELGSCPSVEWRGQGVTFIKGEHQECHFVLDPVSDWWCKHLDYHRNSDDRTIDQWVWNYYQLLLLVLPLPLPQLPLLLSGEQFPKVENKKLRNSCNDLVQNVFDQKNDPDTAITATIIIIIVIIIITTLILMWLLILILWLLSTQVWHHRPTRLMTNHVRNDSY